MKQWLKNLRLALHLIFCPFFFLGPLDPTGNEPPYDQPRKWRCRTCGFEWDRHL